MYFYAVCSAATKFGFLVTAMGQDYTAIEKQLNSLSYNSQVPVMYTVFWLKPDPTFYV